ncbi:hypothetical protein K440DRAFT_645447 [Wilcoxina mikolae CBS 423.85]|nr:hypothetical protein K440DRAFT_645447 [Wilcoxina mikolae CBS 423.85]
MAMGGMGPGHQLEIHEFEISLADCTIPDSTTLNSIEWGKPSDLELRKRGWKTGIRIPNVLVGLWRMIYGYIDIRDCEIEEKIGTMSSTPDDCELLAFELYEAVVWEPRTRMLDPGGYRSDGRRVCSSARANSACGAFTAATTIEAPKIKRKLVGASNFTGVPPTTDK